METLLNIIYNLTLHLKQNLANSFCTYVNSFHFGFPLPKELLSGKIPDIVLQLGKKLNAIELTCLAKANLLSPHEYKADRFKELQDLSLAPCNDLVYSP